jgi:hypothetical protein
MINGQQDGYLTDGYSIPNNQGNDMYKQTKDTANVDQGSVTANYTHTGAGVWTS